MTLDDAHGWLPRHALTLLARLEDLEAQCVHGKSMHMHHIEMAKRARQLADHLVGVLALSDARRYPSALSLTRTALEHHLMDRLIFLARRHVETYRCKKEDVPAEEARLVALQHQRPDLERWFWDSSGMNVVWRGFHTARSRKGLGRTISPYYFLVDEFDPFTGGKKHAAQLASPFWRKKHRRHWAERSASMWDTYFIHRRVMKAIDANRLLPGRLRMQVDIHYSFLSGYAHPSKRGYEAVHGGNFPDRQGDFDHYSSELILLYVITIAAAELEIFMRMCRRQPRLELRDWDDMTNEIRQVRNASSYFWFLGGEPQELDRIDTIHTPAGEEDPKVGRPRRDWRKLRSSDVQYYADPFERLVRLHSSFHEYTTGVVYESPFHRADAQSRH